MGGGRGVGEGGVWERKIRWTRDDREIQYREIDVERDRDGKGA